MSLRRAKISARIRRRQWEEEQENQDRWLISYADFITLLFAFFVVMYAISSVNEGKYRVLSDALTEAFSSSRPDLTSVIRAEQGSPGDPTLLEGGSGVLPVDWASGQAQKDPAVTQKKLREGGGDGADKKNIGGVVDELERTMSTYIDRDLVNVTRGDAWVELEVKSSLLFGSGSARISREALSVLRTVAAILKPLDNRVYVEGFTDNVPIRSALYPSNWELSASRAASVVQVLARYGVEPGRLSATGYGEYRPIADNDNEEGRNRNRRVVMVLMAGENEREILGQRDAQAKRGEGR